MQRRCTSLYRNTFLGATDLQRSVHAHRVARRDDDVLLMRLLKASERQGHVIGACGQVAEHIAAGPVRCGLQLQAGASVRNRDRNARQHSPLRVCYFAYDTAIEGLCVSGAS